jgi:hypothetical protein
MRLLEIDRFGTIQVRVGGGVVVARTPQGGEAQTQPARRLASSPASLPAPPIHLSQHPDEYRPERPVLLAVDQQLREGATLRVARELADPAGAVEVRERQDVEQLGCEAGPGFRRLSLLFELERENRGDSRGLRSTDASVFHVDAGGGQTAVPSGMPRGCAGEPDGCLKDVLPTVKVALGRLEIDLCCLLHCADALLLRLGEIDRDRVRVEGLRELARYRRVDKRFREYRRGIRVAPPASGSGELGSDQWLALLQEAGHRAELPRW